MSNIESTKFCNKCGWRLPLSWFGKHSRHKDGLQSNCKICKGKTDKAYREANDEAIKAKQKIFRDTKQDKEATAQYRREYYETNREREREQQRLYRELNAARIAEIEKRWREANPEYAADYQQQYYLANKESLAQQNKQWRQAHPVKMLEYSARRRARKRGADIGTVTSEIILQMLKDQDGLCAYCEVELDAGFEVEHMIPLVRGGKHCWSNLAISCPTCNRGKGSKTVEEYVARKSLRRH